MQLSPPPRPRLSVCVCVRLEALRASMPSDVEVSIDPEELEGLDDAAVRQLYEARLEAQRAANKREDFSDMVASKAREQVH
jgi:hypothetical protein